MLDPDIGMPQADAQRYFKELVSGVVSILYHCPYCDIIHI